MIHIEYSSIGFVKKGKSIVNNRDSFVVDITNENKKKSMQEASHFLFENDEQVESIWLVMKIFLSLFNFMVVHFYALANNYNPYYETSKNLVLYESQQKNQN